MVDSFNVTLIKPLFKVCSKCNEGKHLTDYYNNKNNCWCKKCYSNYSQKYMKKNSSNYKKYLKSTWDKPNMIFSRKKANAKKEGIIFNISKEQFINWYNSQELCCHYCKIQPKDFKKTHDKILLNKINLGLDRINNNLGYEIGNITLCCNRCNTIKSSFFSYEEMLMIGESFVKPIWREKGINFDKNIFNSI
ncbi:MAG: hypothetical protein Q8Q35_04515 [Nanoarchaeota archaeon]|nr:hypothetical protein [Nanoarchaeota archaeon]